MRAFLSHISEEAQVAKSLKEQLERAIPGAEVFASAVDVRLGDAWLELIDRAIREAKAVIVLCSRRSTGQPWVNFESGAGWSRKRPVIPVCHAGLTRDDLPYPLSIFQGIELNGARACEELARRLGHALRLEVAERFDFARMAERIRPQPPVRSDEVGVVLTHGQSEWERGPSSVFRLPDVLPEGRRGDWTIRQLRSSQDLLATELNTLCGIVLGNPWRRRMEPDVVIALEEWVIGGGRLLMLGFELGDRHHGGNLGDLAYRFGIHFHADIVGPPGHTGGKPYGLPVRFDPADADPHPLTVGLQHTTLSNVQTVHVEPGGTEWLRVGTNAVYRPTRDSVEYRDGTLTQPRAQHFEVSAGYGSAPVGVEAPPGLCGTGGVAAIGTWQILGPRGEELPGNDSLLFRMLDWLSGRLDFR